MADVKKPRTPPARKGPKGAPAPKGLSAKLNKEVHVGPLSIPYWGIGAIAIGAWWLWFHVIRNSDLGAATDTGPGGSNLGSGSGGGGGGGQTGAATPKHRHHNRKHGHTHRGGHNTHHHKDKRPDIGGHLGPARNHGGAGLPSHKPGRGNRQPAGFRPNR